MELILCAALILAVWRWWHWKREAYLTRDAALRGFKEISALFREQQL